MQIGRGMLAKNSLGKINRDDYKSQVGERGRRRDGGREKEREGGREEEGERETER